MNPAYLIENTRGAKLVAMHRCEEPGVERVFQPLTHALVVARHGGRPLFILNSWKGLWELPGGVREHGETPRQCAERELLEETGQVVESLNYLGVMEIHFSKDGRTEYGALFAGEITAPRPFTSDGEAREIVFWDGVRDLGEIDAIDLALTRLGGGIGDAGCEKVGRGGD